MNSFNTFTSNLLPAFDVVVAILVTLYISVAIFAAQNIFKVDPGEGTKLNVSGRHYVRLLQFFKISVALLLMPVITKASQLDWLKNNYSNSKAPLLLLIQIAITVYVVYKIQGIITQKALNNKYTKNIKQPALKFAAWLISNEKQWSVEKGDLITSSFADRSLRSVAFDEFLLDQITANSQELLTSDEKSSENAEYIITVLNALKEHMDKRPLNYPPYYDNLIVYILASFLKVDTDRYLYHSGGIYSLRLTYAKLLEELFKISLTNGHSYELFQNLQKHLSGLSDEKLERLLLCLNSKLFLEEINQSPESTYIWEDFFPREWLLTYENLIEKRNPVAVHLLKSYLSWAQNKLLDGNEFNRNLDETSLRLFPDVDPILWARILEYRFVAWSGRNHMEFVIGEKGNFGLGKGYPMHNYTNDEESIEFMRNHDKMQLDATIRLAMDLGWFNEGIIREALSEIQSLESNITDERQLAKLDTYKKIFTAMSEYLASN